MCDTQPSVSSRSAWQRRRIHAKDGRLQPKSGVWPAGATEVRCAAPLGRFPHRRFSPSLPDAHLTCQSTCICNHDKHQPQARLTHHSDYPFATANSFSPSTPARNCVTFASCDLRLLLLQHTVPATSPTYSPIFSCDTRRSPYRLPCSPSAYSLIAREPKWSRYN